MIKSFFKTFKCSNFNFFKSCYDGLLSFYNRMSHAMFSRSKAEKTWKHECSAGCGLVGCAYGQKHQSPSYKKAQGLFFAESIPSRQRSNSLSYAYSQEGSYLRSRG